MNLKKEEEKKSGDDRPAGMLNYVPIKDELREVIDEKRRKSILKQRMNLL